MFKKFRASLAAPELTAHVDVVTVVATRPPHPESLHCAPSGSGTRKSKARGGSHTPFVRGTAALLAVIAILQFRPAQGSPGDIFSIPSPEIGFDPPKATDIKDGDASVATATGAAQYAYPIQVPPGRNGMAPQLSLNYASTAPTYGALASGWSLSVPIITEDHSQGRLRTRSSMVEAQQAQDSVDPKKDDRFISSLAGGQPLIAVIEPSAIGVYKTYRARNDASFARYERMTNGWSFRWRVRTTDGRIMLFGETSLTTGCTVNHQYAPLTSETDKFGNTVQYTYTQSPAGECRLDLITWGRNGVGIQDFAYVSFSYDLEHGCNAVYSNSQVDYRSGFRLVTGASRLRTINAVAHAPGSPSASVHTRRITLAYDETAESCSQPHAPVRLLTSIQESAWLTGEAAVNLPAVSFEYNSPRVSLLSPAGTSLVPPQNENVGFDSLGWGYRRGDDRATTVESMWLDVDGDGLQDVLHNSTAATSGSAVASCSAEWFRNLGPNPNGTGDVSWAAGGTIALPRLKWRGNAAPHPVEGATQSDPNSPNYEGCSLNGQVTAYMNSNPLSGACHHLPSASCVAGTDPLNPALYCRGSATNPGYTHCPQDKGGPPPPADLFRTQLAYRWLDMDSDGLVDLVGAVHGDIDSYDIERGNDFSLTPPLNYNTGEASISGIPGLDQWPSCASAQSSVAQPCKQIGDGDCLTKNLGRSCTTSGCTTNWGVVLSCLASTPTSGCAGVLGKQASGPSGQPSTSIGYQRHPYERCEGRYPWLIYRNLGRGEFATTPIVKYQPVPLESTSGDSSLGAGGLSVRSENHAIMDFDGDGKLDAVVRATERITTQTSCSYNSTPSSCPTGYWCDQGTSTCTTSKGSIAWQVWLGDGTGGFGPQMHVFPTRPMNPCPAGTPTCDFGGNAVSGTAGTWGQSTLSMAGLLDVNGDGAQDHWIASSAGNANVAFNYGDQLGLVAGSPPLGEITTPTAAGEWIKPGNDTFVCSPSPSNPAICQFVNPFQAINKGRTSASTRAVDVDHDGRVDIATLASETAIPKVHFNLGGQFNGIGITYGSGGPAGVSYDGLRRRTEAVDMEEIGDKAKRWRLMSDLFDLDGDGIAEGAYFDASGNFRRARPASTQPPRLLRAVHNGRGAHSTITYAQMHDTSAVTQSPQELWWDGRPKASPRAQWVAKSIRVVDDLALTDATSSYLYTNPRFGADDEGDYSFRGFERVTTTLPSGAKREETYSFSPDWSGRLAKVVMRPAEALGDARSIELTTWEERTLFGDAVKTYHPTVSEHLTCFNGQTESTCTPTSAAGYTKTTLTLTALVSTAPAGSAPVMWQETSSLLQGGTSATDGDRKTDTPHALKYDANTYILVETGEAKSHRIGGAFTMYAKSATTWTDGSDTSYRVPYTEEVWSDTNDANRAITRRTYDLTTGNVTQIWKPVQWAANPNTATNTLRTTLLYDTRKLFVASETNELGHVRDFLYEYGTGTKLRTQGPNIPPCVLGPPYPACPAGSPLKEEHRIRVDGLGRMIERYEVFANQGESSYRTYVVETNVYADGPAASVTHQSAIDHNGTTVRYKQNRTDLDGHGRPIMETVFANGSAAANQITRSVYANDGTLAEVKVPDPTLNDLSTVSYVYTFDSLGRPLTIRRPDSTVLANRSGIDMAYNGLTTTATEVGAPLEQSAVTTTRNDAFGRLAQVDEQLSASPVTWSSTRYCFGPDDNVATIVDPEGAVSPTCPSSGAGVTTLTHDFAGRRKTIIRGGRTWAYAYDKNDNMTSETPPCIGSGCQANYTSSIVYDALDRPTSKLNAPRTLTTTDRALFGSSSETFTYDGGWNSKGRLDSWKSFAPGASTPTTQSTPTWNVQGQPLQLTHTFSAAGFTNNTRSSQRLYNISGDISAEYLGAVVGNGGNPPQSCTSGSHALYSYDNRGLLMQVQPDGCLGASTNYSYVTNTRNVAGLVTKRFSQPGVGPFLHVESNWSFDRLGRVTSQVVKKGAALEQVVRQVMTYFGNDDPQSLDHYLGLTNHKLFTFGYDKRHQLSGVTESALPNAFTATYNYGTAGRFSTAIETGAALPDSDVRSRNVTYQYSAADPERLLSLKKNPGTKLLAQYTYDEPGNQLTRSYPDTKELWEYVYDGKNQLRRVTKKLDGVVQGSEEYWYDESGKRTNIVKRSASNAVTELRGFINSLELHYSPAGLVTRGFAHANLGTTAVRLDRSGDGPATVEYQFHGLADHLIAAVNQTDATINASFIYAPFGEIVEATNAGGATSGITAHRQRFNDKYVDEISDLGYYGFRYYDRLSMTWTQSDPLYRFAPDAGWKAPRRAQLYMFTGNNPLRYLDPDGRLFRKFFEELTKPAASFNPSNASAPVAPGEQDVLGSIVAWGLDKASDYAEELIINEMTDELPGGGGGDGSGGGGDGTAPSEDIENHDVDPWGRTKSGVLDFNISHQSINTPYHEKEAHGARTDAEDTRPTGHREKRKTQSQRQREREKREEDKESDGKTEAPKGRRERDDDDDDLL